MGDQSAPPPPPALALQRSIQLGGVGFIIPGNPLDVLDGAVRASLSQPAGGRTASVVRRPAPSSSIRRRWNHFVFIEAVTPSPSHLEIHSL